MKSRSLREVFARNRIFALTVCCLAVACECAGATYKIPAPLAPVNLQGMFPIRVTAAANVFDGTLTLALDAKGGLTGQLQLAAKTFTVTGKQSFKSGKGSVAFSAISGSDKLAFKATLQGSVFKGTSKGSGTVAAGSGVFTLNTSAAGPLVAYMSLVLQSDAKATLTGAGGAQINGAAVALAAKGKGGSKFSLAAKGNGFQWSAKGIPSGSGYLISTKSAGYGASGVEAGVQIAAIVVDLGTGAISFTGAAPGTGLIHFADGEISGNVNAFIGEAIVFFNASVSATSAASLIQSNGGTIAAAVPNAGYYLVQIASGTEADFVESLSANLDVDLAIIEAVVGDFSVTVGIFDNFVEKKHGECVAGAFVDGGGIQFTPLSIRAVDADGIVYQKNSAAFEGLYDLLGKSGGQPVLINISSGVSYKDVNGTRLDYDQLLPVQKTEYELGWQADLMAKLAAIAAVPEQQRENLIVVQAAGNNKLPLTEILARIRTRPRLADALDKHMLLVGSEAGIHPADPNYSNLAPGDEDFAMMQNDSGVGECAGEYGSSFAAPRALAVIQKLILLEHLTARQALQTVKLSAANNGGVLFNSNDPRVLHMKVLEAAQTVRTWIAKIEVEPATLAFTAGAGSTAKQSKSFSIKNAGPAGSSMIFAMSTPPSWIQISGSLAALDGGKAVSFEVTVDPTGIPAGSRNAVITISDPKSSNKTATLTITLTITPKGAFDGTWVGTRTGTFTYNGNDYNYVDAPVTVTIRNDLITAVQNGTGVVDGSGNGTWQSELRIEWVPYVYTGTFSTGGSAGGTWTVPGGTGGGSWTAQRLNP